MQHYVECIDLVPQYFLIVHEYPFLLQTQVIKYGLNFSVDCYHIFENKLPVLLLNRRI